MRKTTLILHPRVLCVLPWTASTCEDPGSKDRSGYPYVQRPCTSRGSTAPLFPRKITELEAVEAAEDHTTGNNSKICWPGSTKSGLMKQLRKCNSFLKRNTPAKNQQFAKPAEGVAKAACKTAYSKQQAISLGVCRMIDRQHLLRGCADMRDMCAFYVAAFFCLWTITPDQSPFTLFGRRKSVPTVSHPSALVRAF